MLNQKSSRAVLMLVGFITFLTALTFNTLSGFGSKSGEYFAHQSTITPTEYVITAHLIAGIFIQTTEDVMLKYNTPLTPAQWTFFIWDFIYFWIFAMFIYFITGLCRRFAVILYIYKESLHMHFLHTGISSLHAADDILTL